MIVGLLTSTPVRLSRRTPGRSPFHPRWAVNAALPTGPSASRVTFSVTTITDGNARIGSGGDPVDSDRGAVFEDDLHPRSDAGHQLENWVCHHTQEPTVLSRVSCRPFHLEFDCFHQPCLLPGRTSRKGEDCRPRTTRRPLTLLGQPGSSSFASHWRFSATPTRRYHGRMLIHPSHHCVCHPEMKRCLHTRRFGTLASPPPPVFGLSLRPHPPGHQK